MTENRPVEDTLAEITRHFLRTADRAGWDAPAQIAALDVHPVDDVVPLAGDQLGLAWELRGPVPVTGHPFASVMATGFPPDAIGVVFAVEGWMSPDTELPGDDPLADDVAAHRGPDGRTEIRMAIALLADGTCAQFCQVRGGGMHTFDGDFAGRLPAALNLMVHRPSGLVEDCTPAEVCHRAWGWMAVSVAADAATVDLGPLATDGQPPALVGLLAATTAELARLALPEWFTWLCRHQADGWAQVLEHLRSAPAGDHHMGWLLAAATDPEVLDAWDDDDERTARDRCDPAMLAMLADGAAPERDRVLAAFTELVASQGLDLGRDDLDSLAQVAAANLARA